MRQKGVSSRAEKARTSLGAQRHATKGRDHWSRRWSMGGFRSEPIKTPTGLLADRTTKMQAHGQKAIEICPPGPFGHPSRSGVSVSAVSGVLCTVSKQSFHSRSPQWPGRAPPSRTLTPRGHQLGFRGLISRMRGRRVQHSKARARLEAARRSWIGGL